MEETSMKINDIKNQIVCGIYKIDFPNGKSYIGQSVNIYKRIQEHNQKHRQLVDKAIDKYGKIKDFVLLEMC
jgi:predicted GIY-YIG superfamily endonuclease